MSTGDVFNLHVDNLFESILGTYPVIGDLKVQGNTELEHEIDVLETHETAYSSGLRFNPSKCVIKADKIVYFGNVLGCSGVKPDPKRSK